MPGVPSAAAAAAAAGSQHPGPDDVSGAGAEDGGLVMSPFRALRYDPARVSSLAAVTSPPYDVIEESEARALASADPHNIIRLILPREDDCGPEGPYEHAAHILRGWIADGTLRRDPDPAVYVLEQELLGRRQRGILGALALRAPESRVILPHEDVMTGPVEDRLALLSATQANLEPILLMYAGGGATTRIVDTAISTSLPVLTTTTIDGVTHRLWAITDPDQLATIADDLRPRQALIADGHHRYAAYLRYQRERRRNEGPGPWDRALALLVDTAQTPPDLSSITRVLPGLSFESALHNAGPQVEITVLDEPGDVVAQLLRPAIRSEPSTLAPPALSDAAMAIVGGNGQLALLTIVDPAYQDVSAAEFLSTVLLRNRWRIAPDTGIEGSGARDSGSRDNGLSDNGTPNRGTCDNGTLDGDTLDGGTEDNADAEAEGDRDVRYVHNVATAITLAAETGGVAIVLRPPTIEQVVTVAQSGRTMPRKSTAFGPKPRDGLVMRTLAER
jgi:uncharacterized protein (DUF1015 family)